MLLPICSPAAPRKVETGPWKAMQEAEKRIKAPKFKSRNYVITDFYSGSGAYTEAIHAAISKCSANGGGHVVVPAGEYLTGPIRLESNVDLHLNDGAVLKFSTDPADYPVVLTRWQGYDVYNVQPLIYAKDAENIAVTGKGLLDGQASKDNWLSERIMRCGAGGKLEQMVKAGVPIEERHLGEGMILRPQFINFYNCRNVLMEDFTINRAPFWQLHPFLCTNVTVRRVTMDSHMANNDGCDPESCTDVLMEDCTFDTGDDCIAIKAGKNEDGRRWNAPTRNIIVRGCHMRDGHAGVAIGSEMSGGVYGVYVEDCDMDSPALERVIRIKSNPERGGVVADVHTRNVTVGECDLALLGLEECYWHTYEGDYLPEFRNVSFENVTSKKSRFVLHVDGRADRTLAHDISFRNCNFDGVTEREISRTMGADGIVFENVSVNGKPYDGTNYDVVVAKDGSGDFTTVQAAINSLRSYKPEGRATVFVKKGIYEEKVVVWSHKTEVSLIGEDRDSTVIIWHDHGNIPDPISPSETIGTFRTYTMKVDGNDFICENLTISNDAMVHHNPNWYSDKKNGANVAQAVALHVEADRALFRNCRFLGFQDTIFTGNTEGREMFVDCYIEGTVDFIFGPATVWFERCHVHALRGGYYTAASTPKEHRYGYVFNKCRLTSEPDVKAEWLGRPWREFAYTLFKECEYDVDINPAGWNNWSNPANEKTARYHEYRCTGRGADTSRRAAWSSQLSDEEAAQVTLQNVMEFSATGWNPGL